MGVKRTWMPSPTLLIQPRGSEKLQINEMDSEKEIKKRYLVGVADYELVVVDGEEEHGVRISEWIK